jgi:predicted dehydrogenase
MRLGLVGVGVHGTRYARHLAAGEVPGARLVAIARRDAAEGRRQASELGVRHHGDAAALLADPEVDAVALVVPPRLHLELVSLALDAGKPVLVEKPLAPDAAQARRIVERVRLTGTPLMVAQTLRYNHVVRALRAHAPSIAPIYAVALAQRFEPSRHAWLDEPGNGGVVLNTGVHIIDLARWLTGAEVAGVQAETRRVVTTRTEDCFAAVMRLEPGGIVATLDASRATGGRNGRIELVGRGGQLAGDHVLGTLVSIVGREATPLDPGPPVQTVAATIADFVRALEAGEPMPIPAEEGARNVEVVERCLGYANSDIVV